MTRLLVVLCLAGGCRTRPFDEVKADAGSAPDLAVSDLAAVPDLAAPDLAHPDLAHPDLAVVDLASPVCPPAKMRTVETFAAQQKRPVGLAVDRGFVYWLETAGVQPPLPDGALHRLAIGGGGAPETLASGLNLPRDLVVAGDFVYFTNSGDGSAPGTIMKVPVSGGAPVTLATKGLPGSIITDGADLYWTDGLAPIGSLLKLPLAGGTPVTLVSNLYAASGLAVDGSQLYFTRATAPGGTVEVVPVTGGAPVELYRGAMQEPFELALDAQWIYFTDDYIAPGGRVLKVPRGGGPAVTLAGGLDGPWALALDGDYLYWTNLDQSVMRVRTDGNCLETLAPAYQSTSLAVDADSVYFAESTPDGRVLRVDK